MVISSLQNTTHSNTEENNNFTQIYKYEDAYAESLKYFNNNGMTMIEAEDIWQENLQE